MNEQDTREAERLAADLEVIARRKGFGVEAEAAALLRQQAELYEACKRDFLDTVRDLRPRAEQAERLAAELKAIARVVPENGVNGITLLDRVTALVAQWQHTQGLIDGWTRDYEIARQRAEQADAALARVRAMEKQPSMRLNGYNAETEAEQRHAYKVGYFDALRAADAALRGAEEPR